MSLWTPGGEHEVPRDRPAQQPAAPAPDAIEDLSDLPGYDDLTPEQQAQAQAMARELAEARERIAQTPAAEVVANHAMGLYELAAIHLGGQPPALDEAKVAIDAHDQHCERPSWQTGGETSRCCATALQQLQLAYVQLTNQEGGTEQIDDDDL